MKKTAGFYLSVCSAVLTLVCIILYGNVLFTNSYVRPILIVSLVLSVVILAASLKAKSLAGNILPLLSALLIMAAITLSIPPMVNTVVFAFMGMNPMSNAQGFLVFAGAALCAWLFSVIASFCGLNKKIS